MMKPVIYKTLILLKFGGLVAKLSVFCTVLSTFATLFDAIESDIGWAIDAVCIAVYLVSKTVSIYSYDKTEHIPPIDKSRRYAFATSKARRRSD